MELSAAMATAPNPVGLEKTGGVRRSSHGHPHPPKMSGPTGLGAGMQGSPSHSHPMVPRVGAEGGAVGGSSVASEGSSWLGNGLPKPEGEGLSTSTIFVHADSTFFIHCIVWVGIAMATPEEWSRYKSKPQLT